MMGDATNGDLRFDLSDSRRQMTSAPLEAWLADVQALVDKGEFAQTRTLLLEVTKAYPASAAAWKALGVAENKLGNHAAAEGCLLRSVGIDESDSDAWSSLGGVYVTLERYEDALRAFEKGLATGPEDTYSLLNYLTMAAMVGESEVSLDRHSAALAEGQRICETQIERAANIPWCDYDLAQILFLEDSGGDFMGAIREGLSRSNEWQAASARRTYELLTKSRRFRESANAVLAEFARDERARRSGSPSSAL
jgi:tetratricopeptide (TPR) repeat protein